MTTISFFVPGAPVAQPRQRHRFMQPKQGKGFVMNFTPKSDPVNSFKAAARIAASAAYNGGPITGPVQLNVTFLMPRPGNMMWKKRPMPREHHCKKPDRDNLEKALKDALKGITWVDDSQVCDGRSQKLYAAGDETPGVIVEIKSLEPSTLKEN